MLLTLYPDVERTVHRLRLLLHRLGSHGGSITPSIYETAQVLRFCPQLVDGRRVAAWLLHCQYPDGGWGAPDAPLYRTVPTLAAVLALHEQGDGAAARQACCAGLRFLAGQKEPINADSGQFLPVAIELILPRLLDEAEKAGMHLPRQRFAHIDALCTQKRALIARHPPHPAAPPMFSWEAWGEDADPALVGESGGVGHSPAATAWWLHLHHRQAQHGCRAVEEARARAIAYLDAAGSASGSGIRGVVPSPWPMNRFEQSFTLHTLVMAGLSTRHELVFPFVHQARALHAALHPKGVGFSDTFAADGDDTAAALSVVASAGLPADAATLAPFQRADHFVAYPFELHQSHTVTARATQALAALGGDVTPWRRCVLQAQQPDGWWNSEKWSRSRLYGTHIALAGLERGPCSAKRAAVAAFLRYQHYDGGWGSAGRSTPVETAYGLLSLCRLLPDCEVEQACRQAIAAAHAYLCCHDNLLHDSPPQIWISKDLFCARRIDQATILCALLAAPLADGHVEHVRRRSPMRGHVRLHTVRP